VQFHTAFVFLWTYSLCSLCFFLLNAYLLQINLTDWRIDLLKSHVLDYGKNAKKTYVRIFFRDHSINSAWASEQHFNGTSAQCRQLSAVKWLRKCPYNHWLTNKAYLSAITVTNISQRILPTRRRQKSTGIDMERNYVTVTHGRLSPPKTLEQVPSLLSLPCPSLPFFLLFTYIQLGVLGERCKLPQRGLGRSSSRNRIWCISALKYNSWWQQF